MARISRGVEETLQLLMLAEQRAPPLLPPPKISRGRRPPRHRRSPTATRRMAASQRLWALLPSRRASAPQIRISFPLPLRPPLLPLALLRTQSSRILRRSSASRNSSNSSSRTTEAMAMVRSTVSCHVRPRCLLMREYLLQGSVQVVSRRLILKCPGHILSRVVDV